MSSIILKKDLFNEILLHPAEHFDELCVVSGFATPAMAVHHLSAVEETFDRDTLKINLIIGMTPLSGISKPHHKNFVKLAENRPDFVCSYIEQNSAPIHTKLYTWLNNGKPEIAFLTSANYTLNAFRQLQDEVATECNPEEAFEYYNSKIAHSSYCTCPEVTDLVVEAGTKTYEIPEVEHEATKTNGEMVKLPLFSERTGKIHNHAGLNWGQRDGREPNQAYIPIPSNIARSGFFPPRGEHFSVLTDDGIPFVCAVAQQNDKAIHTSNNNSEFGEYFRRKLNVPLGKPISLANLDRYGNRYVSFTKINEEEYYMEFQGI
ncbi:NgoFVII family restriction endonuclease [Deferribacterales bacterium RsTz2092]|nr:NgoFVII family restriction endonuclease [Deferribacterales bacterium]